MPRFVFSRLSTDCILSDVMGVLFVCVAAVVWGCTDVARVTRHHIPPPDEVFAAINLNYRAVNLALVAPYDTVTLTTSPTSLSGSPLQPSAPAEFISSSDRVVVFPNGTVRAQGQTSASGILVLVKMTIDGVTLVDTVRVTVTDVANPPRLALFRIQPEDVDTIAVPMFHPYDLSLLILSAKVVDSSDKPISRVVIRYDVSSSDLLAGSDGVYQGLRPGDALVYAQAYVYGIAVRDSIHVRVAARLVENIIVLPTGRLIQSHVTISKGGGVYWVNQMSDSLDIVFDTPLAAEHACCTQLGMLVGDTDGNIAPFMRDLTKPLTVRLGGVDLPRAQPDIVRGRTFSTSGVYGYRSTKWPHITGTITVVDWVVD